MKRIAIIGVSSALGLALARALDADPAVERVLGLDAVSLPVHLRKLTFLTTAVSSLQVDSVSASWGERLGQALLEHWIDSVVWLEPAALEGDVAALESLLDAIHRSGVLQVVKVRTAGQEQMPKGVLEPFLAEHPEVRWGELTLPLVCGEGSAWEKVLARRVLLVPHRLRSIPLVQADRAALAIRRLLRDAGSGTVRQQDIVMLGWGALLRARSCVPIPASHRALWRLLPHLPEAEKEVLRGLLALSDAQGVG